MKHRAQRAAAQAELVRTPEVTVLPEAEVYAMNRLIG